ncbi:MAG: formate dehydrogenase subunit delta [Oceanicoccus sp.]|jgi:formate dehydrogenase subunit delta
MSSNDLEQAKKNELTHLVKMANQISANIGAFDSDEQKAKSTAEHMLKFWAKPMKQKIQAYAKQGGDDLSPVARQAISLID